MTVDDAVNWPELARSTDEFGGAQLKAVCVEAGMIALRKGMVKIGHEHYVDAIAEVQAKKKVRLPGELVLLWAKGANVCSFVGHGQFLRLRAVRTLGTDLVRIWRGKIDGCSYMAWRWRAGYLFVFVKETLNQAASVLLPHNKCTLRLRDCFYVFRSERMEPINHVARWLAGLTQRQVKIIA